MDVVSDAGDFNAHVGSLGGGKKAHWMPTRCLNRSSRKVRSPQTDLLDNRLLSVKKNFCHQGRHWLTCHLISSLHHLTQIDNNVTGQWWRGSVETSQSFWPTIMDSDHASFCARFCLRLVCEPICMKTTHHAHPILDDNRQLQSHAAIFSRLGREITKSVFVVDACADHRKDGHLWCRWFN